MITISICLIVKNEEDTLAQCLDSLKGIGDEIIITDTGSTDRTKEIAAGYTDKIYDFKWTDDFSAARNFCFSKAVMEYIYTADADEVLAGTEKEKFLDLKNNMSDSVEIVQMKYVNDTADNNLQNSITEYRPKLFKRLRQFEWIDPIHEMVRLNPIVFDSDVYVNHCPKGVHIKRDFRIFNRQIRRGIPLSKRIRNMYARELLAGGEPEDFYSVTEYFENIYNDDAADDESKKEAACVLARAYRLRGDYVNFFKYALKDMLTKPCSEMCFDIGEVYYACRDYLEAAIWYYNAVYETQSILDIHASGDASLGRLADCYKALSEQDNKYTEVYMTYRKLFEEWKLPEEL